MQWRSAFPLLFLSLVACRGEELARVKLTKTGDSGDAKWVVSGARRAQVWAEYNGKWTGGDTPTNTYEIELLDGDKSVSKTDCSTSSCGARVCSSKVSINGNASGDCECKTSCTLEAPNDGTFTVKARVKDASAMTDSKDLSIILRK
jgi:hypothetical protein